LSLENAVLKKQLQVSKKLDAVKEELDEKFHGLLQDTERELKNSRDKHAALIEDSNTLFEKLARKADEERGILRVEFKRESAAANADHQKEISLLKVQAQNKDIESARLISKLQAEIKHLQMASRGTFHLSLTPGRLCGVHD
jgi:uncharacterized protein YydD (DUF2326 family)